MFVISAKPAVGVLRHSELFLTSLYTDNYTDAEQFDLRGYMINSIIVATGNSLLVTTLGFFAAYALSRYPLVGKENIFFWTITNRMAPAAVFLLPLFLLYTQAFAIGDWKLYDTRIGLILLYCIFNLPFAIWTLPASSTRSRERSTRRPLSTAPALAGHI